MKMLYCLHWIHSTNSIPVDYVNEYGDYGWILCGQRDNRQNAAIEKSMAAFLIIAPQAIDLKLILKIS